MLCLFRLLSLRRPAFWAEIVHLQVVEQKVLAQLAAQGRGQVFKGNIHDFPAMPADQMVMLLCQIIPVRHPLNGDLADQTGVPQLVQIVVYRCGDHLGADFFQPLINLADGQMLMACRDDVVDRLLVLCHIHIIPVLKLELS